MRTARLTFTRESNVDSADRIDTDAVAVGQVRGGSAPDVRMNGTAVAQPWPQHPTIVATGTGNAFIFFARRSINASTEVLEILLWMLYGKTQTMPGIAMSPSPATFAGIRFGEIAQRDPHLDLGFTERSQCICRPWQVMKHHIAAARSRAFEDVRLKVRFNDQRHVTGQAAQGSFQARHTIAVPPKDKPLVRLVRVVGQMREHRRGPFGRMDDQRPHCFRPEVRLVSQNPCRHAGDLGGRGAGIAGHRKGALFRSVVRGQKGKVVEMIAVSGGGIDTVIAALKDNIRFDGPVVMPAHRSAAAWRQITRISRLRRRRSARSTPGQGSRSRPCRSDPGIPPLDSMCRCFQPRSRSGAGLHHRRRQDHRSWLTMKTGGHASSRLRW
jgi:hypothetical protein